STSSRIVFHDPATHEIYTLSLHDALPISLKEFTATQALLSKSQIPMNLYDYNTKVASWYVPFMSYMGLVNHPNPFDNEENIYVRSEEHTSELQSRENLVCRLLLEKKKKKK